jgi:hypothetical protein
VSDASLLGNGHRRWVVVVIVGSLSLSSCDDGEVGWWPPWW